MEIKETILWDKSVVKGTRKPIFWNRWMASYFSDRSLRMVKLPIDEVKVQKRRQRSSLLFWGTELIQFHAALQDDLKKWRNIRTDTWRNGRFRSSRLHHTNPPPSKMDVLPKTFLQIILAVKWLVRHSSTVHSANSSDDLFLLFCLFLLLWVPFYCTLCVEGVVMDVLVHVHCTVQ